MPKTKTKIVVTIGPSSLSLTTIKLLIKAGANVFRINASHGGHEQHTEIVNLVRQAETQSNKKVAILYDLQGPKIRIGDLGKEVININKNETIYLHDGDAYINKQNSHYFPLTYKQLTKDVKIGQPLLLKDGLIELEVTELNVRKTQITCKVITGGSLKSKTSLNAPETELSTQAITEQDRLDLAFIRDKDIDFIALSFVRQAKDLQELRNLLDEHKINAEIIAKIERPEALKNLEAICKEADAIMVARGDLGIEIPAARVPIAQQAIIKTSLAFHTPVIIATQVLSSMINHPRPTRAEVSDAALAVMEGADAIMLSNETAIGEYPVEAVETLNNIIHTIETETPDYCDIPAEVSKKSKQADISSLVQEAYRLATNTDSQQLVFIALKGTTANLLTQIHRLSQKNNKTKIQIFSNDHKLQNKINLVWGLHSCEIIEDLKPETAIDQTIELLNQTTPKSSNHELVVLVIMKDQASLHLIKM